MAAIDEDRATEELVYRILSADDPETAASEALAEHPRIADRVTRVLGRLRREGWVEHGSSEPDSGRQRIGGFRIERTLGAGGMGIVHLARDEVLDRRVALKVLRPEFLLLPASRERFRREVESVARLQHRGIVPVYSVAHEGESPFYTMEFVDGPNLARVLTDLRSGGSNPGRLDGSSIATGSQDGRRRLAGLSWPDACTRIALDVGEALAHAHDRGVLHRDVKPSNILVAQDGTARLVDFGLAAIEGAPGLTRTRAELGSLPYAPPETVAGRRPVPSPTLDVYSLGVTLYELLALDNPFVGRDEYETRKRILAHTVPKVRVANRQVSWELETVCLVAMDPDPSRRYPDMASFAADLERCLEHRSIRARRPSRLRAAWRFAQRHPSWTAAVGVALVLLTVGSVLFGMSEHRARSESSRLTAEARRASYAAQLQNAAFYLRERPDVRQALELLHRAPVEHRGWEWWHLRSRIDHRGMTARADIDHVRDFSWVPTARVAAFVGLGNQVIVAGADGSARRLEIEPANVASLTPDARHLYVGAVSGAVVSYELDVDRGESLRPADGEPISGIVRTGPGRVVIATLRGNLELWDTDTASLIVRRQLHRGSIRALALDPTNTRIATGGVDGRIFVLDANDGSVVRRFELEGGLSGVADVALTADARIVVAIAGTSGQAHVLHEDRPPVVVGSGYKYCAVGPDGSFAAVWREQIVRVFHYEGGRVNQTRRLMGPGGAVAAVVWPSANEIVTASTRGEVCRFDLAAPSDWRRLPSGTARPVSTVAVARDRNRAWAGDFAGEVVRSALDLGDRQPLRDGGEPAHRGRVTALCVSSDGTRLLSASLDGTLAIWDAHRSELIGRIDVGEPITDAALLPHGRGAVIGTTTGAIATVALGADEVPRRVDDSHDRYVTGICVAPNGMSIVSASEAGDIACHTPSGRLEWRIDEAHASWVSAVTFTPDGRRLASAGADRAVRLWDASTGAPLRSLWGHRMCPSALAFVDGGARLVSAGGGDREIRVWLTETGDHLMSLIPPSPVSDLVATADVVLAGTMARQLVAWGVVHTGQEGDSTLLGPRPGVDRFTFSPSSLMHGRTTRPTKVPPPATGR